MRNWLVEKYLAMIQCVYKMYLQHDRNYIHHYYRQA
jgi:hypothetical protein